MKATVLLVAFAAAAHAASFEVVSIKPSTPSEGGMRVGCRGGPASPDPARWTCQNLSLANLVSNAYSLRAHELIAPEWMNQQRFDINAKLPEGATREQFREMMQTMLAERFGLKVHREKREMQGFELVVAKGGPKFKESSDTPPPAIDQARPAGGPKLGDDGFPQLSPGMTMAIMRDRARANWSKATMDFLALNLGYQSGKPVVNATGLTGKYDISIYWVAGSPSAAAPPAGGSDAVPTASDPAGPTLFTALQEQLGLKLEPKKVTIEVVVVDHAEKLPSEN